jgi:glucose-1-phosphate cytidylyltransferase
MEINPTILVLCGGRGERLKPLTNKTHKSLTKIGNKTILQHLVEFFKKKKLQKFIFTTGYKSKQIKNYLNNKIFEIDYSVIDSGNASIIDRLKDVYKIKSLDTIICYGDTLANINIKKYFDFLKKNRNKIILTVYRPEIKFGIISLGKKNIVNNFQEKPKLNLWINIGYIYMPKIMINSLKRSNDFVKFLQKEIKKKNVVYFKHSDLHITVNTLSELDEAKKSIKNFS